MKRSLNRLFKSIGVFMAVVLCASFVACSPNKPEKPDGPQPSDQTKVVSSIEITTNPTKTAYFVGEKFDPAGMVVTAKYTDNTSAVITDYGIRPDRALTKADSLVEIYHGTKKKYVNITVSDKVITGTEYVFQAETAKLEGNVSTGGNKGKPLACYNIVEQSHADGKAMINNFNAVGNAISWTIESDKACEAKLTVVVAARGKKTSGVVKGQTVGFDEMFTTEVNSEVTAFNTDVVPTNGDGNEMGEFGYFELHEVSVNINLIGGDNVIKLNASDKSGNLDCIKIIADAKLTDKTAGVKHTKTGMALVTAPTAEKEGVVGDLCSVCSSGEKQTIPALNKTDYKYELVKAATFDEDGSETYTYDAVKDKDGNSIVVNVVIPATNKRTYRLEAEKAVITGTSASGNNKDKAVDCNNIVFKPTDVCSEGLCLTGMNKSGNTVKFSVNSDKATAATVLVRVSARVKSGKGETVKFKEMYTMTVGGTEVAIPDSVVVTPTDGNDAPLTDYYQFHDVEFDISLSEGTNDIVFTVGTAQKAGNLDYIELTTDAVVTDLLTETSEGVYKHDVGWIDSKKPTAAAEGLLVKGCRHCGGIPIVDEPQSVVLPVLSPDTEFYTYELTTAATETADGLQTYTYVKDGVTFTYTVIIPATGVVSEIDPVWVGSTPVGGEKKLNFFNSSDWTEGKRPEADTTDNSLKITSNARIDYLGKYEGTTQLNPTHNDAAKYEPLIGEEFVYSMQIKSTGNFGIMLFATSGAGWNSKTNRAMRFAFENGGKIKITNGNSGSKVGAASKASYSFTEYTRLDFAIVRKSTTEVEVRTYINGRRVVFEVPAENTDSTNVSENGNFKCGPNGYGCNIEFVALNDSVINVTTPLDSRYKEETPPPPETGAEEA